MENNGITAPLIFSFRNHLLLMRVRKPFNTSYRCSILTRIGKELYPITKTPSSIETVKAFVTEFPKHNVLQIVVATSGPPPHQEIVWSDPNAAIALG